MKLIFEHIIVNGYIIDVYGDVDYYYAQSEVNCVYFVNIKRLKITKDGFPFHEGSFAMDHKSSNLFIKALEDTEKQYQQYLMEIYNGY